MPEQLADSVKSTSRLSDFQSSSLPVFLTAEGAGISLEFFFVTKTNFMEEENKMNRRQVIGGLGATLAAAAVTPVFASPGKK